MIERRLVVASLNRAKAREIAQILAAEGLAVEVLSLADFADATLPPETGSTFAENALAKARHVARLTGLPAVADDSGLEVDALGGEPGIRSARYVEACPESSRRGGDEARYRKVLDLMRAVPDRQRIGRFRCAAAYATPAGEAAVAEGVCEGAIARVPAGSRGFGYDPIFIPAGDTRTMAQLSPPQKHAISHRGKAFRALARMILSQHS